jgi:hypothetical protein
MAAIRRAREQGIDRMDEANNSQSFDVIWVYETFMRCAGEDWTFLSVGDKCLLTDPKPVREVYPEQFGERPLTWGIGSFEAFRLFPMSSAESWQMLQMEANDLRNLTLDAVKQNVLPVTKVVRGRQVDLDALKRRGQGSSIMVTNKDDVTWDRPPEVPSSVQLMKQSLDIEFDDLAGQQNYSHGRRQQQPVEDARRLEARRRCRQRGAGVRHPHLDRIVVRADAGAARAPDPVLRERSDRARAVRRQGQAVREVRRQQDHQRAVGERGHAARQHRLGNGDPSQRLAKFSDATQIALPLLQQTKEFQTGEYSLDIEGVMDEVYGAAGYKDGGKRFIKKGQPQQNPMQQPQLDNLNAKTAKDKALAKKAILDAISNAAKVGLDVKKFDMAGGGSGLQSGHRALGSGRPRGRSRPPARPCPPARQPAAAAARAGRPTNPRHRDRRRPRRPARGRRRCSRPDRRAYRRRRRQCRRSAGRPAQARRSSRRRRPPAGAGRSRRARQARCRHQAEDPQGHDRQARA